MQAALVRWHVTHNRRKKKLKKCRRKYLVNYLVPSDFLHEKHKRFAAKVKRYVLCTKIVYNNIIYSVYFMLQCYHNRWSVTSHTLNKCRRKLTIRDRFLMRVGKKCWLYFSCSVFVFESIGKLSMDSGSLRVENRNMRRYTHAYVAGTVCTCLV